MISQDKQNFIRSLANPQGHIEPAILIEQARDPECILHDEFEWDEGKAAQAHWLDRARELIRIVRIEMVVEHREIRAPWFVIDPDRPPQSRRYIATTMAANDRAKAREIISDEMGRIVAAIRRARAIASVLGLDEELEQLLQQVNTVIAAAEAAEQRARQAAAKRKGGKKKKPTARGRQRQTPAHA
jgi:hypothetical protein